MPAARLQRTEPLGQVLVRLGLLTREELDEALERQKRSEGMSLGEMLVGEEKITRDQLARAMALRMGVGFFTLADGVDPAVARLVDEKTARRYQAVPVRLEGEGRLVVAMADPSNVFAIDDLRILTRHEIRPVLASAEELQQLLGQTSRLDAVVADLVEETRRRPRRTASRPPTSPTPPTTRRWCAWSTRSSPAAWTSAPRTSTSSRRPRRWWSATAWTACCARSPPCRSAWRTASRAA